MTPRISFNTIPNIPDCPDLLEIQIKSFNDFLQLDVPSEKRIDEGLNKVFKEHFPIEDARGNFLLEFIDYTLDVPKYSPGECIERGLTYCIPLKARLRLIRKDDEGEGFETIEQEVYLGNVPYMTPKASFIINGSERVVVSQIHKSPGVFFSQTKHPSGTKLYSARIIPFKGTWIEFATDVNQIMYAYIDRKKKFPVTTLLRAIGYATDKDILDLFDLSIEVKATKELLQEHLGKRVGTRILRSWTEDFVDEDTGEVVSLDRNEVLVERNTVLDEATIKVILEANLSSVVLYREDINVLDYEIIYNTLHKDNANSEKEALEQIFRQLRSSEPPDEQTAREAVQSLFFSDKRCNLGQIGRYKINKKLGTNTPIELNVLTKEDIVEIVKYLIKLVNSKAAVDDIDHLSNRRLRTVGEHLYGRFEQALTRMVRAIKEGMNVRDSEDFKPSDLINPRTTSVITTFFATDPLSQLMDQVNPLSELTHKRRVSALGIGGLSKDRAGFEARDVHTTHYGRLCPIESPEGPSIGLVLSMSIYARITKFGYVSAPYYKVNQGIVDKSRVEYLTAEQEDDANIAKATSKLDKDGRFIDKFVKARRAGDFPLTPQNDIHYIDVSENQVVSASAALIPFLEHDDASRALMGSNMQRQALPILRPEAPIVGTGMEGKIVQDFRGLLRAESTGVVIYVDAQKIVIKHDRSEDDAFVSFESDAVTYSLLKMQRTNQSTCIDLKPIVNKGDRVQPGQILCEGYATQHGELALGRNLKVAFMSWRGYNYEDAIIISERVAKEDLFTSLHLEEYKVEAKETKLGPEQITSEIPNVSEESVANLDKNGIVSIGTFVNEGDLLVGKITPKGEADPTPEERFLRSIFGDKAVDVKDLSLRLPSSTRGVVVKTRLFSRPSIDKDTRARIHKELEMLKKQHIQHLLNLRGIMLGKLLKLLEGEKSNGIYHRFGDELVPKEKLVTKELLEQVVLPINNPYRDESYYNVPEEANLLEDLVLDNWTTDKRKNELLKTLVNNYNRKKNAIIADFRRSRFALEIGDELPTGVIKLAKVLVVNKRKLQPGDKMAGRHGNKGIVSKVVPEEDMPFLADGTPIDIILSPLGIPSRMNLGQIFETLLGWVGEKLGEKYAVPVFGGPSIEDIARGLERAGLPPFGESDLYDGQTGEKFDRPVTVGVIYMLKLDHLVEDKIHARSVGGYTLISQQPLGGRSQFGGQRFGEMEVWALEAYGAAHTLQEMLTIKSDDINGRSAAYEAIVKGTKFPEPGIPESFNVLTHELRGLGLEITLT